MVLHPERRIPVLMTADTVGGMWNYCVRLREEYSRRAYRQARTYTLERMADRYHRVYLDLIRRGRASPVMVSAAGSL